MFVFGVVYKMPLLSIQLRSFFTAKSFQKQVDLWQATKASSVGEENIGQLGHFEGCQDIAQHLLALFTTVFQEEKLNTPRGKKKLEEKKKLRAFLKAKNLLR